MMASAARRPDGLGHFQWAEDRISPSVLIADDDQMQTDQLTLFLRSREIDAFTVNDGFDAARTMAWLKPAVVLLDLKLPRIDGLQLARFAARLTPPPKIILISGVPDLIEAALTAQLKPYAVVQKPVSLADLLALVRRALDAT